MLTLPLELASGNQDQEGILSQTDEKLRGGIPLALPPKKRNSQGSVRSQKTEQEAVHDSTSQQLGGQSA
jgi:hypothetical protein